MLGGCDGARGRDDHSQRVGITYGVQGPPDERLPPEKSAAGQLHKAILRSGN